MRWLKLIWSELYQILLVLSPSCVVSPVNCGNGRLAALRLMVAAVK
jgi:hypothetical protein